MKDAALTIDSSISREEFYAYLRETRLLETVEMAVRNAWGLGVYQDDSGLVNVLCMKCYEAFTSKKCKATTVKDFKSWIKTTTRNFLAEVRRRERTVERGRQKYRVLQDLSVPPPCEQEHLDQARLLQQLIDTVKEFIPTLPQREREAIQELLRRAEQKDAGEHSPQWNESLRRRLTPALRRLRALLEQRYGPGFNPFH